MENANKLLSLTPDIGKPVSEHRAVRGIIFGAITAVVLWVLIAAAVWGFLAV